MTDNNNNNQGKERFTNLQISLSRAFAIQRTIDKIPRTVRHNNGTGEMKTEVILVISNGHCPLKSKRNGILYEMRRHKRQSFIFQMCS